MLKNCVKTEIRHIGIRTLLTECETCCSIAKKIIAKRFVK